MSGTGFHFEVSGEGQVRNPVESDEGTEADKEDEQPDEGEEQ